MERVKRNLPAVIMTLIAILLPMIVGVIFWNLLPEKLPSHYNSLGEVDAYADKAMAIFGQTVFFLVIHVILMFTIDLDPRKAAVSDTIYKLILWLMPALNGFIFVMMYLTAMDAKVNTTMWVTIFMGVLYIILGNLMPKARRNYSFGFRLRWALDSDKNWEHTHRFAGWVCVICGLLLIVAAIVCGIVNMQGGILPILVFVALIGMTVPTSVYSYLYFVKHKGDADYYPAYEKTDEKIEKTDEKAEKTDEKTEKIDEETK